MSFLSYQRVPFRLRELAARTGAADLIAKAAAGYAWRFLPCERADIQRRHGAAFAARLDEPNFVAAWMQAPASVGDDGPAMEGLMKWDHVVFRCLGRYDAFRGKIPIRRR